MASIFSWAAASSPAPDMRGLSLCSSLPLALRAPRHQLPTFVAPRDSLVPAPGGPTPWPAATHSLLGLEEVLPPSLCCSHESAGLLPSAFNFRPPELKQLPKQGTCGMKGGAIYSRFVRHNASPCRVNGSRPLGGHSSKHSSLHRLDLRCECHREDSARSLPGSLEPDSLLTPADGETNAVSGPLAGPLDALVARIPLKRPSGKNKVGESGGWDAKGVLVAAGSAGAAAAVPLLAVGAALGETAAESSEDFPNLGTLLEDTVSKASMAVVDFVREGDAMAEATMREALDKLRELELPELPAGLALPVPAWQVVAAATSLVALAAFWWLTLGEGEVDQRTPEEWRESGGVMSLLAGRKGRKSGQGAGGQGGEAGGRAVGRMPRRVRSELLRLGLQSQLEEVIDQHPPLLLQRQGPSGSPPTSRDAVIAERERAVERIMQQFIELGPREELLRLPQLVVGRAPLSPLPSSKLEGEEEEVTGGRALPNASVAIALEADWELVYATSLISEGEGVSGGSSPAGGPLSFGGASRQSLPSRLLEQMLQVTGSFPPLEVVGPVLQSVHKLKHSLSRGQEGLDITEERSSEESTARTMASGLFLNTLQTSNTFRLKLWSLATIQLTLNVAWAQEPGSGVSQSPSNLSDASISVNSSSQPWPEKDEVAVEGLTVEPLEILGSDVTGLGFPLLAPFPATIMVPGFLRPLRGGHMVVLYVDDLFRIDCDDLGVLYLLRKCDN